VNAEKLEKAIEAMERKIMDSNLRKHPLPGFHGFPLLKPEANDKSQVKALVGQYNSAVRSYNALGGHMGHVMQGKINETALARQRQLITSELPSAIHGPIPQVFWAVSLFMKWLLVQSAPSPSLFQDVDSVLHLLEMKMKELLRGPNGIMKLHKRIADLRSTP
jgi:hypothetical protein